MDPPLSPKPLPVSERIGKTYVSVVKRREWGRECTDSEIYTLTFLTQFHESTNQ